MISHHPSLHLIQKYAQGDLQAPLASVISAHVEHCSECLEKMKKAESDLAEEFFSNDLASRVQDKKAAWSQISSRLSSPSVKKSETGAEALLQIEGQSFKLPRSLKSINQSKLKWMPFGRGGKISRIAERKNENLFLIYLAAGETVPRHSHQGGEYTYVISGSYKADGLEFNTGDFSYSDQTVTHSPQATSQDGCLILSNVEDRLYFLHGFWKPLNGVLWCFLHFKLRSLNR